jgi:pimeloyl-ACP methyl ester carboxylesterase
MSSFFRRLASFSRLILYDKRGQGVSDPPAGVPTLEEDMEDLNAVLVAAGSERAALFGYSEGGPMSALFAATYPDRVTALVLFGTYASGESGRIQAVIATVVVRSLRSASRSLGVFAVGR